MDPRSYLRAVNEDPHNNAGVPASLAAELLDMTRAAVIAKAKSGELEYARIDIQERGWRLILVSSLLKVLNEREAVGKKALPAVRKILKERAARGKTITYGELMAQIGMSWRNPHHRHNLGKLLGRLSEESQDEDGFMISTLAVLKNTGRPNEAFYDLAKQLRAMKANETSEDFWQRQVKAIFRKFRPTR